MPISKVWLYIKIPHLLTNQISSSHFFTVKYEKLLIGHEQKAELFFFDYNVTSCMV